MNPKACQLTAYSRDELLRMNIYDLMQASGAKKTKIARDNLDKWGEVVLENTIKNKNGYLIHVSVNASFFDQANGIIMGSVRDISEIKKREMDLNNIIQGTNVGTWQWNIQEDTQLINEHWAQMLGYTLEELQPLTTERWQSMMNPEDLKRLQEYLDQHFQGINKQFECECRFKHKKGHWVWVLSRGRVLEWSSDGNPLVMFGTHLDITQLKETEKQLIQLSKFQSILMKIASKYINLSTAEIDHMKQQSLQEIGEFVQADRAYIFKYDWKKRIAINTYEWCLDGIEPQKDNLQAIPLEKMPKGVDCHKKGEMVYFKDLQELDINDPDRKILEPQGIQSLLTIPIMNGNHCEGFVGFDSVNQKKDYSDQEKSLLRFFTQILLNINTRAKLENKLIKEKEKALAASHAKSNFLANMSHEIRTPLNGVIGFCSVLMDTNLTEDQREYTDTIMSSGRALLEIINDILDLSKIEAGKMSLSPEKTDLFKLMSNAATIVNLKADEKNNQLMYKIDKEVPRFIVIDPIRLKQILINLLSNATKFTKNGEIKLTSKLISKDQEMKSCLIEFAVRDTGIGIKPKNKKKILEPFSQEDDTVTKKYGGTGLGLAIIKSLLKQMQSQLKVESDYGKGSTFSFKLQVPYVDEDIQDPQLIKAFPKQINTRPNNKPKKVLIVEDHDVNMRVAEQLVIMINKKATILKAQNGEKALEIFRKTTPDIILLDIRLPDISGYDVAKNIREINKEVPIIALTAMAVQNEKEKCLSIGMNHYLPKPLDLKKVKEIIRLYL